MTEEVTGLYRFAYGGTDPVEDPAPNPNLGATFSGSANPNVLSVSDSHYASLPWNTPEREHFASTWWKLALVWLMKCVPVERGGDRREVGAVLRKLVHLMRHGEVALVFPEGGRSRFSRVDTEAVTYGVGRIVKELPGCRVVCVYLRGEGQETWSALPKRGERFRVQAQAFEPKSDHRGMRGSLDISRQILGRLAEMEQRHFDGR